jgi:cysteinyl-tRNA synthetase
MLSYQGDKMSKSLGNLVLVRDLLHRYSGNAIRHYLVGQHYRSEVDFVEDDLKRSADAVEILRRASLRAEEVTADASATPRDGELSASVREHCTRFLAAMDADLDTPRAMPELAALAEMALATDDAAMAAEAGWMVRELGGRILGLRLAAVPAARSTVAA